MKRIFILSLLLASCGGGEQQTLPTPAAITVDDLHPNVQTEYAQINAMLVCGTPYQCGDMVAFDCQSQLDGPKNYYNNVTGLIVMRCGGACVVPNPSDPTRCKACPPNEWICKGI